MQQVGGSLGTALLNTLAVSATAATLANHPRTPQLVAQAAAHGYTTAFWVSALLLAAGAVTSGTPPGRRRARAATWPVRRRPRCRPSPS
jgi:hypothetical protein